MIPLAPALVLAFLSFLASAFVVLRIIIPILPPSPLSRRVSPSEFGLPTFRSLAPADKGHLWLAGFDIAATLVFIWHVVAEATSGPVGASIAQDPLATIRLWFVMTARPACLLMIAALTLLHVRMGRSFSFGKKHWMLWTPVFLLIVTSTALAGVLAGAGVNGLFPGLAAYTGLFTILTSVSFTCLFVTLFTIKKNLSAIHDDHDNWPSAMEAKARPSFGTEEIDAIAALRDGDSWVTSTSGGSRRNSVSAWSFSTHHTAVASVQHGRPSSRTGGSVPAKSSFWFSSVNHDEFIPPVPPLPSPLGHDDPDPFRRDAPSPLPVPRFPRERLGSQTSWLTSTAGTRTSVPEWDFPPSMYAESAHNQSVQDLKTAVERPSTPALATAQVLGGYGFAPGEKGLASLAAPGTELHLSLRPVIGWFISIWLPFALALPYMIILSQQATVSTPVYVLYVISVTISGPLLALNVLFGSSLPIPTGLFDIRESTTAPNPNRQSTAPSELPRYKWSHEYKRSMSTTPTVVEGRRSGDVWITKGDAVDGKSKLGRAISMLSPNPKLSVIPPEDDDEVPPTPPLPYHEGDSSIPVHIHSRSHSETSAQFGRLRKESKASSNYNEAEFASRIMIAQRHYSALAQTVVLPAGQSPEKQQHDEDMVIATATGAILKKTHAGHLRTRSTSSVSGPQTPTGSSFNDISPPPPFPLPPTPPNVRAARLAQMAHKKSFSSSYSFNPIDNMNEIDALTAGVLPLLVPGLKVGKDMKIKDDVSPPGTWSKSKGKKMMAKQLKEFGGDFSSPEVHSTPARKRGTRARKDSHKAHFSLPSLGLGKDGIQSLATWGSEIRGAIEHKVGNYMAVPSNVELGYRNTVFGAESIPNNIPHLKTVPEEETAHGARLGRVQSTRSLGLRAEVPHNVESVRSSMMTIHEAPPSAASTVTLFEEFEAGLMEDPRSHSTPHSTVTSRPSRQPAPPMPKPKRRTSITYIKSDENQAPVSAVQALDAVPETAASSSSTSALTSFTNWSSRAVRPLIPKTGSFKRKNNTQNANTSDSTTSGKPDSPRESNGGLRQLSLLQERDTNSLHNTSGDSSQHGSSMRPLNLSKKQKRQERTGGGDENAAPSYVPDWVQPKVEGGRAKNLKPLKLARSETSKMRAILRKNEVLPDVVVRPPSTTEHHPFVYSFRDD